MNGKNPGDDASTSFAPTDLIELLKNIENEICISEINLKDENDKRNKYKVNMDSFIYLFLRFSAREFRHSLVKHSRMFKDFEL